MTYKSKKNRHAPWACSERLFSGRIPLHEAAAPCYGTKEYMVVLADRKKIEKYARDAFALHNVIEKKGDLDKFIPLIEQLYTIPDPKFVREKAKALGITLTNEEVKKMCWVLLGFQRAVNDLIVEIHKKK